MTINKLEVLLKQHKKMFHTSDLALLWNIENKNTLYTSIKRYVKKGILFPIHKGLYSIHAVDQLDPIELGVHILHRYCYVSTETVLSRAGIIAQATYRITFVSDSSKTFACGSHNFLSRKLKPQFLYNTSGISQNQDGGLIATTERAIADMLYFQPHYHFDATNLINWETLHKIQKEVGYV